MTALAAVTLVACGAGNKGTAGSSNSAASTQDTAGQTQSASISEVVARVGDAPITRAQVNHWMTALAGSIYYFISHELVPEGMLSDPPNYPRCLASLEAAAAHSPLGHARESAVELLAKCRELNQVLKSEATSYLIGAQQAIQIAQQEGITVTPAEVQQFFQQSRTQEYPTEAALREYLKGRRHTLDDRLLEVKLELLGQEVYKKLKPHAYTALLHQYVAKTTCQPGYIVEACRQYRGGSASPSTRSPSTLMEQVLAIGTGVCSDLAGCARQVGK
ncbi:MAG TPA: hypothetical protein VKA66_10555 [Mycobacterium sp.]|nr:hypothetical protein [Mycobacterium sp.]